VDTAHFRVGAIRGIRSLGRFIVSCRFHRAAASRQPVMPLLAAGPGLVPHVEQARVADEHLPGAAPETSRGSGRRSARPSKTPVSPQPARANKQNLRSARNAPYESERHIRGAGVRSHSAFRLIPLQGAETPGNVLKRPGTARHGMLRHMRMIHHVAPHQGHSTCPLRSPPSVNILTLAILRFCCADRFQRRYSDSSEVLLVRTKGPTSGISAASPRRIAAFNQAVAISI